jgi:SAM-dependent methyltransferase
MARPTSIRDDTSARHLRKYSNRNPIHRFTLGRFFDAVARDLSDLAPATVLEFGCGEGLFLQQLEARGVTFPSLLGIDLREDALAQARALHPAYRFDCVDLFAFAPPEPFDLVIASQVLEHLIEPGPYLEQMVKLTRRDLLLTVPWEPWFRLMNLARGRDLRRWGNHPEHVNHWGLPRFQDFVGAYAVVKKAYTVFPFIIVLAQVTREEAARV